MMAWIKVEHATLTKPEVLRAAEMLGIHRDEALGIMVRFWIWLDNNLSDSCPDFVRNISRKGLDEFMHVAGFAAVLESVGWAEFDDKAWTIRIVNAKNHNGNPAKTRALDAKRKSAKRLENVRKMSGENRTRLDKTREELKTLKPMSGPADHDARIPDPPGFIRFWLAYPNLGRRNDKAKCLILWRQGCFEGTADAIVAHVLAMAGLPVWRKDDRGEHFEPAPLVYLRGKRWQDGLPDSAPPTLRKVAL